MITRLFDEAEIAAKVATLADAIAGAVSGELTAVGLLNGSFVFMADLVRALDARGLQPRVEFIRVASYGDGTESSGDVQLLGAVPTGLEHRRVLLVDDILDTGHSLAFAKKLIMDHGAAEVLTCVLLDKPSRRVVDVSADFVGFTVDDVFVVGYGIDYAGEHRSLPYIGKID